MEEVLKDHAAVLLELAEDRKKLAKQAEEEARQFRGLAAELLAVHDVLVGGANMIKGYHPQPVNLNDKPREPFRPGEPQIDLIGRMPSNNGRPASIYHVRVGINQSEQISKAAREAAGGKVVGIQYPNGELLVLTSDNFDKKVIPHANEEGEPVVAI